MIRPTAAAANRQAIPDGFTVQLHADVEVGDWLVCGARVIRLSSVARKLLTDRQLVVSSTASATLAAKLLDLDLADPVDLTGGPTLSLTVVVPVRDNAAGVDRLLAGLAGGAACIVVDDASRDPHELAGVVGRHGAELLRLDRNVGPAAARDAGLARVATDLVAFIDSDVQITLGSLERLGGYFADPALAAAAPRVRSRNGARAFQRYEAACGSLDLGGTSATIRPWSRVSYVPSACLVARVDALGEGFDPRLRSGEDVDLVWRLLAAGHRVRHVADVEALHDVRSTPAAWLGRKAFYGTSAAALAQRHGDLVAPAAVTSAGALVVAGALVQRPWSWAVAGGGLGWMLAQTRRRLPGLAPRQQLTIVGVTARELGRQTCGVALRHWWPLSLLLAVASARARRGLVLLAVADTLAAHRASGTALDPLRFGLARRADDLAYGAGLWWGAAQARSVRCLLPRLVRTRSARR